MTKAYFLLCYMNVHIHLIVVQHPTVYDLVYWYLETTICSSSAPLQ